MKPVQKGALVNPRGAVLIYRKVTPGSIFNSGTCGKKVCSCTHILVDSVWMVEAKHSLTDDHCFQLDTASLESTGSQRVNIN